MVPIASFDQFRTDFRKIQEFPLNPTFRNLLCKSSLSEAGQWPFSQDEMELLELYVREGIKSKFQESCLIPNPEGGFYSKGIHYFKEYSKHYGYKQFSAFLEDLLQLLEKISGVEFENDDLELKCKVFIVIADEILNHLCWGNYLAYQAGGVRKNFQSRIIDPDEMMALQRGLLMAARFYMSLPGRDRWDIPSFAGEIRSAFRIKEDFGFISGLASKGTRDANGSFFRTRLGCDEIKNCMQAFKISQFIQESKARLDCVIAPFYSSLSCAALAYASLLRNRPELEFFIHVYSACEDHVKIGEWDGLMKREIMSRLSQVPPLVRPSSFMANKNVLIVTHALGDGRALSGLFHYYKELGADKIYLSAVEAEEEQVGNIPLVYKGLEISMPPIFRYTGPSALRQLQKEVSQYKIDRNM